MSNKGQSWTVHNIGKRITFGKSVPYVTVALGFPDTLEQIDSTLFLNEKKLKSKFAPYSPAYITTLLDSDAKEHDLATSPPLPTSEGGGGVICISYNRSDTDELVSFTGAQSEWALQVDSGPQETCCVEYQGRRFWATGQLCFDARVKKGVLFIVSGNSTTSPVTLNVYIENIANYSKNQNHYLTSPILQYDIARSRNDSFLGAKIAPECNEISVLLDRVTVPPEGALLHSAELRVFSIQNADGVWWVEGPAESVVKSGQLYVKFTYLYEDNEPDEYTTEAYSSLYTLIKNPETWDYYPPGTGSNRFILRAKRIENLYTVKWEPMGTGYYTGLFYDNYKMSPTYNSLKFLEFKWKPTPKASEIKYKRFFDKVFSSADQPIPSGDPLGMPPENHPIYPECVAMLEAIDPPRFKEEMEIVTLGKAEAGLYIDGVFVCPRGRVYDDSWLANIHPVREITYEIVGLAFRPSSISNHYGDTGWIGPGWSSVDECASYFEHSFTSWQRWGGRDSQYSTVTGQTSNGVPCTIAMEVAARTTLTKGYSVSGVIKEESHSTDLPVYDGATGPYKLDMSFIDTKLPAITEGIIEMKDEGQLPLQGFLFEVAKGVYLISMHLHIADSYDNLSRNNIWLEYADGTKIMDIDTIKTATGITNINNIDNIDYRVVLGTSNII